MRCKYDFSLEVRVLFWHLPGNMKSNVFRSKTGPSFILSVGLAATGSLFKLNSLPVHHCGPILLRVSKAKSVGELQRPLNPKI